MITTEFVRKFEGLVKTVAYDYEKDPQKFEDLTQDIWLQVCRKADLLPKDEAAYSTWLQVLAENVCKHHIKNESHQIETVLDSQLTAPVDSDEASAEGSWIEQSVPSKETAEDDVLLDEFLMRAATLSEQETAIFNLVYWHGFAPAAVAKRLGVAESTVRNAAMHMREKLEVKDLYHSAHTYHSPGTVWKDWSWKPDGEGNKRMGPTPCVSRPDLVAARNAE